MRAVIQRVNNACVRVDGEITGEIGKGYLILLGVGHDDTKETADKLFEKIVKQRLFEDENGKMNLSIRDIDGEILTVSQFTLYADTRKGTRPGFTDAAPPDKANELYEYFLSLCEKSVKKSQHGIFGADMKVSLENDGPVTICMEID